MAALVTDSTVLISVYLDEAERTEHPHTRGRPWVMDVRSVGIEYVWSRSVGYWRVMRSTVRGFPVAGPCPDEYTYDRQDPHKPMWLAALELRHYPRELGWNTSTHVGR